MPLHYNLRLCDSTAFLCIFSVSLKRQFSDWVTGSFHPVPAFPTPASCRDWRDFLQAQPWLDLESETAPHSRVCTALSPPDGIKNVSCSPQAVPEVCLACFLGNLVSHLAVGFFPSPPVGAGFSCWQPAHLISVMLFVQRFCPSCPTHYTCIHILLKLSGHRISILGLFL